ncbi:hypothetical protein CGCTS75_v014083 [Colletotrichum tropicale]|nr:hypothetical protein CGCTS75_v014083 [Colletotrichum tropicale]
MKQIVNKLRTGGEGMFLWVFLTIEDICSCPTDDAIRQTLDILPRKLSDTFNRALERILASPIPFIVDLARRIFRWVATVHRPLTRWELGEALGVEILQKSSIEGQIINTTERIPSWCENLVQIEAGDDTVRFFHHSIKTYLLEMEPPYMVPELATFHIDKKAWDHEVGEVCLTYLNFSDFERALTKFSPDTKSLPEITSSHAKQIALSNEGRSIPAIVGNQTALIALSDSKKYKVIQFLQGLLKPKSGESLRVPERVSKPAEPLSKDRSDLSDFFFAYPFLLYAKDFWLYHTFHFQQSTTKTWDLWKDQVTASMLEDDRYWASFGQQQPGFETFDSKAWLADENNLHADTSRRSATFDAGRIALHKAIIFADFIAHWTLMDHVLATIRERGENLSPRILEQLLPSRRVFQFPRQRDDYIEDETSHDGLVSLAAEYVAWGGPFWPSLDLHCLPK